MYHIIKTYIAIWQAVFQAVGDFFKSLWDGIKAFFQGIWDFLVNIVKTYVAIWQAVFTAIGEFFTNLWHGIGSFFTGVWEKITGFVQSFVNFFKGVFDGVKNFFTGLWDTLSGVVKGFVDKILGFFKPVADFFSGIGEKIASIFGGKKTLSVEVDASDVPAGSSAKVPKYAKGTSNAANTAIVGENGPELVTGIKGAKVFTADKTREMIEGLAAFARGSVASIETAQMSGNTRNVNITQNISFDNTFNGDRAGQQKSAGAMGNAAKDTTAELARGLAYAR